MDKEFINKLRLIDPKLSPFIRELPGGLQLLAQMNQVEQGNQPNVNKKLTDGDDDGNFQWISSNEGVKFWVEVDVEYGKYP